MDSFDEVESSPMLNTEEEKIPKTFFNWRTYSTHCISGSSISQQWTNFKTGMYQNWTLPLLAYEIPTFMTATSLGGLNLIIPFLPLHSFISRYLNEHHLKACNEK